MRALIVVVALLGTARVARGDDLAQAKVLYNAGRDAFYAAKYDVAIASLEQALRLAPDRPSVVFALGKAYRFQFVVDGDDAKAARAVALLRTYIAQVSEGDDRNEAVRIITDIAPIADRYAHAHDQNAATEPPKQRTELMITSHAPGARASVDHGAPAGVPSIVEVAPGSHSVHVEAAGFLPTDTDATAVDGRLIPVEVPLRDQPGALRVTARDGADIAVDGRDLGAAPLAPIAIAPGPHVVAITARGTEAVVRQIAIGRGQTVAVDAPAVRTARRTVAYGFAIGSLAVAAGAVTATGFALAARSDADAIANQRADGLLTEAQRAAQNGHVDDFDRDSAISYVLYGGAAALLATSAYLYFFDTPRGELPPPIVAPVATPGGGASLVLTGSFR
jgi:hypothetical protein|nr:PEGA domain-containing protein [Kofleriaceae bacterium]